MSPKLKVTCVCVWVCVSHGSDGNGVCVWICINMVVLYCRWISHILLSIFYMSLIVWCMCHTGMSPEELERPTSSNRPTNTLVHGQQGTEDDDRHSANFTS
ncbi:hypothetical protein EON63_07050 [archaeon]|nr:MAG: hypothetical protein EON63_07050 [archaeon]